MMKFLSKFVLDVLPSIAATVIGAYIVAHYINPKTSDAPKAAVATESRPAADDKTAAAGAPVSTDHAPAESPKPQDTASQGTAGQGTAGQGSSGQGSAGQGSANQESQDRDTKEREAQDRSKEADPKGKTAEPGRASSSGRLATRNPANTPVPGEERRDANDLARAVIERLRGNAERARAAEIPQPQPAHIQSAGPIASAPATAAPISPQPAASSTVAAAPALPPPVIVASPAYVGRGEIEAASAPAEATGTTGIGADRLVPPADIPSAANALSPRPAAASAEQPPGEQASIADHLVSTTKSFFRAFTPH